MSRAITGIITLFLGFFTLLFSLVLAIPLTIAALITGKRIQNNLNKQQEFHNSTSSKAVIEGEYEELSK